jgi:BON domain-containing protein
MMEPFFGSNPLPSGAPFPGFGWFQLPFGFANRPTINPGTLSSIPNVSLAPQTVAQPMPQEVYGFGGAPSIAPAPGFMGQTIGPATFGVGMPGPALGIQETGTVRGLLQLVAMRRGQPMGPTSDAEIEEFIYDALEFLPGSNEVEVRVDGGRAMLTGSVPHKRLKRDVGEIAWAIPAINDVQNNMTITTRRRRGQPREGEPPQAPRKQG